MTAHPSRPTSAKFPFLTSHLMMQSLTLELDQSSLPTSLCDENTGTKNIRMLFPRLGFIMIQSFYDDTLLSSTLHMLHELHVT